MYFRTDEHPQIKEFNLSSFNFDCQQPSKMIDMSRDKGGPIDNDFIDYDPEINKKILLQAFEAFRRENRFLDYSDADLIKFTEMLNAYECANKKKK